MVETLTIEQIDAELRWYHTVFAALEGAKVQLKGAKDGKWVPVGRFNHPRLDVLLDYRNFLTQNDEIDVEDLLDA